jgi:hypothetical protein
MPAPSLIPQWDLERPLRPKRPQGLIRESLVRSTGWPLPPPERARERPLRDAPRTLAGHRPTASPTAANPRATSMMIAWTLARHGPPADS